MMGGISIGAITNDVSGSTPFHNALRGANHPSITARNTNAAVTLPKKNIIFLLLIKNQIGGEHTEGNRASTTPFLDTIVITNEHQGFIRDQYIFCERKSSIFTILGLAY